MKRLTFCSSSIHLCWFTGTMHWRSLHTNTLYNNQMVIGVCVCCKKGGRQGEIYHVGERCSIPKIWDVSRFVMVNRHIHTCITKRYDWSIPQNHQFTRSVQQIYMHKNMYRTERTQHVSICERFFIYRISYITLLHTKTI